MNDPSAKQDKDTSNPVATTHSNKMPLQESSSWWSGWADIFGAIGIVLGGIAAILAMVAFGFAWKAGKLKDAALEMFKADSGARISEADAKAAKANENAAAANERAAIHPLKIARSHFFHLV